MKVQKADEKGVYSDEDESEWKAFFTKPDMLHLACFALRPGASGFCMDLESIHYPTRTPANALFDLRLVEWADTHWFIVSIPLSDRAKAESAAAANGLRITRSRPAAITASGLVGFPIKARHLFSLENVRGHPVYRNRRETK